MKTKKWIAITALLTLVAGTILAGCGKSSEQIQRTDKSGEEVEEKPWTGKITVWDGPRWADANDNKYHWLEAKTAEFEAAHPGVKIEIVQVPWAEMPDKLNVAIAGKAWPDIAPVDISGGAVSINHIKQGVIEPMDEYLTKDEWADFYPNALEAYTYDGKIYGVPNSITVHAMLLNLDLFKERGVDPPKDGRWTYEEFVEKMKQLTFDRDGDGQIDVYGFSTYILPGYYEAWPFLYMDGARPLSEDLNQYTFDDPKAVSALKKLSDLKFVHKLAPPEMGGNDVGGTWKAWAASDQRMVAVEPWATWAIASAQTDKWKTNFMVAEYPIGDSGKPITIGGVGGWVMFHEENDGKKKMVAELIKYLSSTDEQYTMAKNYGVFPARKSAAEKNPFIDNPQMAQAMNMAEQAVMLPRHPDWKKIDEAIQTQLQLVLNGEKTPEEALKAARGPVEEILNQYK
ncbi:MAG: Sugar ABC transporter, periplasmic sugar-binding protein [Candidatus Carbobacillus altaicus]|uniref:Sugar ABC transporter, periplasmic sugar-binding protein n=1 Tax=Candidatus Carbonibacillus altaicus TaxID=2163959 RepID=A0A2R6Y1Z0_9BACL|nr:MAG: Sugar ABC transporter, periplasmic sugar-binding protein [Candidatus Carbobacillus altaicus]